MSLISVEQAAGLLCVSRATAYRMATEGRIPTVRWISAESGCMPRNCNR